MDYNTLVFISGVVRQLALSLDRAIWDELDNLRDYYSHQVSLNKVIDLIDIDCADIVYYKPDYYLPISTHPRLDYFVGYAKRILGLNTLTAEQKCALKEKLKEAELLMHSGYQRKDKEVYGRRLAYLSSWFSLFYFDTLQHLLHRKDRFNTSRVEHFNQSLNHVDLFTLDSFARKLTDTKIK